MTATIASTIAYAVWSAIAITSAAKGQRAETVRAVVFKAPVFIGAGLILDGVI